jgi:hypothetical protein
MWFSSFWEKARKAARASAKKLRKKLSSRKQKLYRSVRVDEMPDLFKPLTVYLCGEGEYMWAAAMICPCGCKDVINLNLLKTVRPRWSVKEHPDRTITLTPSVWRQKGCRSHFLLRRGRIDWCHEYYVEDHEAE